jgi:hypothetical protein
MKTIHCAHVFAAISSVVLLNSSTASASLTTYTLPAAPTFSDEITGVGPSNISPANTSVSLITAAMMGAKFMKGANVTGVAQPLQQLCVTKSQFKNGWPDGCDGKGLASAMTSSFSGQSWITSINTDLDAAVSAQISGISQFHSPILVPILGSSDHWVTIIELMADVSRSPRVLELVKYIDAGDQGFDASGDPFSDSHMHTYEDGIKKVGGETWQKQLFQPLAAPSCAPYCDKYVVIYDPPVGEDLALAQSDVPVSYGRLPGIVDEEEEMSAVVAEDRVWDALSSARIQEDQDMWGVVEYGTPGEAFPVFAEDLAGEPMDYWLVPILDERGNAAAMVRLNMEDGAFEELWVPTRPLLFLGITQREAQLIARTRIARGEQLLGGTLTWSPHGSLGGSELRPYYEYHVMGPNGEPRGRFGIALTDGHVQGLDRGQP